MKRNIMRDFRIDEISGVDVPAQQGATVAVMKRADPSEVKKYGNVMALTTESEGHQHGIETWGGYCECEGMKLSVDYSSDTEGNSHTHPLVSNPLAIGASIGHTHDIDGSILNKNCKGGACHGPPSKRTMTPRPTDEPTLESVQAERDRLAAIVGLSAEERAHFDALPEEMRTSFLGKSAEGRRAEIVAKNDARSCGLYDHRRCGDSQVSRRDPDSDGEESRRSGARTRRDAQVSRADAA